MTICDLTILIPVRRDRRLALCLASIDVECRVLVVLNGATTEFEHWVRTLRPDLEVVVSARAGIGHAYNLGLAACRTEYALLMDSDCTFRRGTIGRIRAGLDSAALSKGRVSFSHRSHLSRVIAAYRTYTTSSFVNAFSPPLGLSRAAIELLLGNFFDDELIWAEDLDFDHRVRARGIRIAYDPDAVVVHPALTPAEDLRAAYHYGVGYAVGARKGVFPSPTRKGIVGRVLAGSQPEKITF
jgi:glycosyltransferase involved in cell wall biosynthesis